MLITQQQAKTFKLTSKEDQVRPVLNAIWLEGDRVTASDSYKLLSVKTTTPGVDLGETPALVPRESVEKSVKIAKIEKAALVEVTPAEDIGEAPKWRQIVKGAKLGSVNKTYVNRKYLIELLQAIEADNVEIGVGENALSPMILTAEGELYGGGENYKHRYFGLLMPLRK